MAWNSILIAGASLLIASVAYGQTPVQSSVNQPERQKSEAQLQRERGIARCKENRGVDCDTPAGQKEWIQQERPITDAERTAAAAARRAAQQRQQQQRRTP